MKCPECQFDNADGMNFCGECGYKLSPSSKTATKDLSFDEKLEKTQKYLPKSLTGKILLQRDKIKGEHKNVFVIEKTITPNLEVRDETKLANISPHSFHFFLESCGGQ